MSGHFLPSMAGAWEYYENVDGNFSVFPPENLVDESYASVVIATVWKNGVPNPEANARLIAAAPEMRAALSYALEALRATEIFMCGQGLETQHLNEIVAAIDELLDRVDSQEK